LRGEFLGTPLLSSLFSPNPNVDLERKSPQRRGKRRSIYAFWEVGVWGDSYQGLTGYEDRK
jgi:hypothetical protein